MPYKYPVHDADIVIVGAGLTGLRAALEVARAGLSVLVVEADTSVGGRLKTARIQGALIDRGFQVLLTGYPELKSLPPLKSLQCSHFTSGARVRIDGAWHDIIDPRRHLLDFIRSLKRPLGNALDLARLALLVQRTSSSSINFSTITTAQLIERFGFSRRFSDGFLKPFLRGVLLDPTLSSDSALARFYIRTFTLGYAALPAGGIQALPELLADALGRQHILLGTRATAVATNRVTLESGEDISARHVICACDALAAATLGGPEQTVPHSGTTTVYFLAKKPPYPEPILVLDGDASGPVNNLAVPSNVQPTYAPPGEALISASVIGTAARLSDTELIKAIEQQMTGWFGAQVADWRHVTTTRVANALPARPRISCGWLVRDGVYYAGDYLSYGSQNGALMAGREVAQAICAGWSERL
jgi:phytoene dehydrogenase-like protein